VAAAWPATAKLDRRRDELSERGIEVVAISAEARERSEQLQADWKLECRPIAYGSPSDARVGPASRGAGATTNHRPFTSHYPRCRAASFLDRVAGTGEHQERATDGMRKLLGGASVDQASDRAISARAYDQQIERCAVQRQLLGRLTVCRVRFDAPEGSDTASSAESLAAHAMASVRATESACSLSGDPS